MVANFRINAVRLVQVGLHMLVNVSNNNQRIVESVGGYDAPEYINSPLVAESLSQAVIEIRSGVAIAEQVFRDFKCPHIDNAIAGLRRWAEQDEKRWSDLKASAIALRDAIDTELKEYLFYRYPKNKGQKLRTWKQEWNAALTGFPSIIADVFSATDCFALEHNTASVFHCMRILESGLGALANDVDLSFDIQQWNTIIQQIEAKITAERKTLPRGIEKNERMQFLSEAAKEFFYFKDGWRNYVSHNRGRYDEHQAATVLEHTRSFMNHLATRLSE